MLKTLQIKNVALIGEATIDLEKLHLLETGLSQASQLANKLKSVGTPLLQANLAAERLFLKRQKAKVEIKL